MWPILVAVVLAGSANVRATVAEVGPSPAATRVPAWDARGLGPLPWQGIACADMTGDGRFVALGTIAPPGDPHLFLLDDRGRIAEQHSIGARWIVAVAVGEGGEARLAARLGGRVFLSGPHVADLLAAPNSYNQWASEPGAKEGVWASAGANCGRYTRRQGSPSCACATTRMRRGCSPPPSRWPKGSGRRTPALASA